MTTNEQLAFDPLPLEGAFMVSASRHGDERGWFARSWSGEEFAARGLNSVMAQSSLSYNAALGTLRGLHFQVAPHEEAKLVTCVHGAIWDVIVDLRKESSTFRHWHAQALDADPPRAVYVPEGFAHGFLTLSDDVMVLYQISEVYMPGQARGIRWDDPSFAIAWPSPPRVISERDRSFEDFRAGVTDADSGSGQ